MCPICCMIVSLLPPIVLSPLFTIYRPMNYMTPASLSVVAMYWRYGAWLVRCLKSVWHNAHVRSGDCGWPMLAWCIVSQSFSVAITNHCNSIHKGFGSTCTTTHLHTCNMFFSGVFFI